MTGKRAMDKLKVSDVAKAAGVSAATVSKVINGRQGVSDETRDRVERLLTEVGYRKKLPTTKTSQSIELVVKEVTNNGSVEMVRESTAYAKELGIGITVSCAGREHGTYKVRNEVSSCLRSAIERNPLGVIILLSDISPAEESLLETRAIPYVIVDPVGQVSADTLGVGIDNWTGGLLATEHLIALGHRSIGAITGPSDSQSSQARLSGYMAALQRSGINVNSNLIKVGDYVSDKTYKAACELLDMEERDRPTAIFAFNDLGAVSVYRAARQRGIRLPDQLSIIGFDDVYPAASMYPALTTIRQPFDLIARKCIDLILEAREGKVGQNYTILPTQLIERESCVPPIRSQ
ncbi:LacI family DNA-binding transcriptional regulator [Bifidobacterium dentium]|uniref:LacI family DNA-binding transcriptional regulator n=1 Tax=Bifidobacterium dentium TaxID=1689 RepID=UPI003D17F4D3